MTLSQAHKPICLDRARQDKIHRELREEWLTPSVDRRDRIEYPSGHVVRVNRAHLNRVLAAKAAIDPDTNGPGLFRGRVG